MRVEVGGEGRPQVEPWKGHRCPRPPSSTPPGDALAERHGAVLISGNGRGRNPGVHGGMYPGRTPGTTAITAKFTVTTSAKFSSCLRNMTCHFPNLTSHFSRKVSKFRVFVLLFAKTELFLRNFTSYSRNSRRFGTQHAKRYSY